MRVPRGGQLVEAVQPSGSVPSPPDGISAPEAYEPVLSNLPPFSFVMVRSTGPSAEQTGESLGKPKVRSIPRSNREDHDVSSPASVPSARLRHDDERPVPFVFADGRYTLQLKSRPGISTPMRGTQILKVIATPALRLLGWKIQTTREYADWLLAGGEPEAVLVSSLCSKNRISIDVGANLGGYTWLMKPHSRRVIAIEPNPELATRLKWLCDPSMQTSVSVRNIALSDRDGTITLRIPLGEHGRATIEAANPLLDGKPGRSGCHRAAWTICRSTTWGSSRLTWKATNWLSCEAPNVCCERAGPIFSSKPMPSIGPTRSHRSMSIWRRLDMPAGF